MQRRPFLLVVGTFGVLGVPLVWSGEKTVMKCLPAVDAGVKFSVTWDRGADFEGDTYCDTADPKASARKHFRSVNWYLNEKGQLEKDNKWATVALSNTDSSSLRIRVLFSDRNDNTIFSKAGDVITAYTPARTGKEGSWTHSGNLLS